MALPATDLFTAANGTDLETYSANWDYNFGAFQIQTNSLAPNTGGTDGAARWVGDTFANDHYGFATLVVANGSGMMGIGVRIGAPSAGDAYAYHAHDSQRYMATYVTGTGTVKGSTGGGLTVNDVMRLEVSGTTVTAKRNGAVDTAVGTSGVFTDSSLPTGSAGVSGWGATNGSRIDSWEGGNLTTPAALDWLPAVDILQGSSPIRFVPVLGRR